MQESVFRQLRKSFSDICKGYSSAMYNGRRVFIKHLSHHEQVDLDILHQEYVDKAISMGIEKEEDILRRLKHEEVWTDKDEDKIKELKTIIERLVEGKKLIHLKSDLENQQKEIEKFEQEYLKKQREKRNFIGISAEGYADKKINEYYMIASFFLNKECEKKLLDEDTFDNLTDEQLEDLIRFYNKEIEVVSERTIKLVCIQDFFQMYWSLSQENLRDFFGKPVCDLTYFQIKLGYYGRIFKKVLESAHDVPAEIKEDPDKLLDFINTAENTKEKMQKALESEGEGAVNSTVFGANKKDYEAAGVGEEVSSLSSALKQKQAEGKSGLDMMDLMKMMGVT